MARVFVLDNKQYPDPDPSLTVDQVRLQFANFFPELATATVSERREGENTVVEFTKRVGTKGHDSVGSVDLIGPCTIKRERWKVTVDKYAAAAEAEEAVQTLRPMLVRRLLAGQKLRIELHQEE